jgi:hypothetical protein
MTKTRLCELAEKYGSDKVESIFHSYTPFYDQLLSGRDVKRVLEVGIGTPNAMNHMAKYEVGASLKMWKEYFPNAEIWGLDNDPSAMFTEPHIQTMMCDQSDRESLLSVAEILEPSGRFDLIIDDGSHQLDHQALTANTLIPRLLAYSGVYVIEDVMFRSELYSVLRFPTDVHIGNLSRTWDDCLFIIEGKWAQK